MGHSRPRFNAKGRNLQGDGSASAGGKKKPRAPAAGEDTNVEQIDPAEAEAERVKRRQALFEQQQQNDEGGKMSSKKKKRLDKFIDKQLKKERRVQVLKEIAAYEGALPDHVQLQSSASLGSRQMYTAQDKLDQARKLKDRRQQALSARTKAEVDDMSSDEEGGEEAQEQDQDQEAPSVYAARPTVPPTATRPHQQQPSAPVASTSAVTLGSGLKRSADGQLAAPTVTKRRRIKTAWGRLPVGDMESDGSEDESDFDSSDSANDSDLSDEEDDDLEEDEDAEEEEEWAGIPSDRDSQGGLMSDGRLSEDEDLEESSSEEDQRPARQKGSFKAWAQAQLDQLEGLPSSSSTPTLPPSQQPQLQISDAAKKPRNSVVLPKGLGPLGEFVKAPQNSLAFGPNSDFNTRTVAVDRPEAVQESRMALPVLAEEDNIMHLIRHHAVIVLSGETGSGKTTQVPQFLLEAGFGAPGSANPGMIGITQPRRVAAVSMAQRVRSELGLPSHSHVVAHQVRYDSTTARETKIKFMTDGVLLRELGMDFLLKKYSVIIVDEAHERTVNTDILLGVLSRVVRLREEMWRKQEQDIRPLRLVIMSATLRLTDFLSNKSLFPKTPESITVGSRQYPVTNHFARRTHSNYMGEAFKKVCKIHARLPPGGILVFLTGQNEIQALCKRLNKRWSPKALAQRKAAREQALRSQQENSDSESEAGEEADETPMPKQHQDVEAEEVDLGQDQDLPLDVDEDRTAGQDADEEDLESDSDSESDPMEQQDSDLWQEESDEPLYILPLYSLLPAEKQMKVFGPVPEGMRLVVVATNVAETSLTIPGIRYVVDSGRSKERHYDSVTGMQSFQVSWTSKASAAQRSGRAGRVGPGHCYRLYSSAVFERYLDDHTQPEILRTPVESMVLQMKAMNIDVVTNFPFPTPPDRAALAKAEKLLTQLGALQLAPTKASTGSGSKATSSSLQITDLGRAMSLFPLPPRFAKMLVAGQQHGCLPYVIVLVCALVVGDPFLREEAVGMLDTFDEDQQQQQQQQQEALSAAEIQHIKDPDVKAKELRRLQRKQFFQVQAAHSALGDGASDIFKLLSAVGAYEYEGGSKAFCESNFLRVKAMEEIHKLRSQISRIVMANFPKVDAGFVPSLPPPSELQLKVLRQLILASFVDQVAVRKDLVDPSTRVSAKHNPTARGVPYRALGVAEEDVFIHPSSVLFASGPPPEFVCYQELFRTSRGWLKTNTRVSANWLSSLGKAFCTYSKVLETPDQLVRPGSGKAQGSGGKGLSAGEGIREVYVTPSFGDGTWGKGVELPPVKVKQKRVGSRWVFVA